MLKPVDFLIEHQNEIMQAYDDSNAKPKKAWDLLQEPLPKLSKTMTFSTFKQYVSVFAALNAKLQTQYHNELSKLRHKNAECSEELSLIKRTLTEKDNEIKREKSRLSKLRQKIHQMTTDLTALQLKMKTLEAELSKSEPQGRNIEGWTVRLTSKGYYHLCKSFGGVVKSIYIGKVLDEEKAKQRIAEYMSKLG